MLHWLRRWWRASSRTASRKPTPAPRLGVERIEDRITPAVTFDNAFAVAFYDGISDSEAQIVDAATTAPLSPMVVPFVGFRGALSVAAGDVNGDGYSDLIVGARAPHGHVKVFDGVDGRELNSFYAFYGFHGAVSVGSADVDGDWYSDVLVSAGGTHSHVKAVSGYDGSELASFFAFPGFLGETSVTGDDFDGDGLAEILVGAGGPGADGRIALFTGNGQLFDPGAFVFPGFDCTISVAAGDVTGDWIPDIVVATGAGVPGGIVRVLDGYDLSFLYEFEPFDPTYDTGVNVQLGDANLDGRTDILATSDDGFPVLAAYDGPTGEYLALSMYGLGSFGAIGYDPGVTIIDPWFVYSDDGYYYDYYEPSYTEYYYEYYDDWYGGTDYYGGYNPGYDDDSSFYQEDYYWDEYGGGF